MRASDDSPVVLITGCSSGIGWDTALRFGREGYRVYASMRRPDERADELRRIAASQGSWLRTPALDVADGASVDATVAGLLSETDGRLDVLVNNAAYYLCGAVEDTSPEELRALLETNLLGALRMTRAVLPTMRTARAGAVVTLSSVSGRVVFPGVGAYHASKFALEALFEALRYEVAPFGVRVTIVEPGSYRTRLFLNEKRPAASERADSPYAELMNTYRARHALLPRADTDGVVDAIVKAATDPSPPLRWPVGPSSLLGTVGRRLTPDALYEFLVRLVFRLWRPSP
jgi:NAD(P)-dependent dehydrogenase (short-subunit alcohol dehydrogenase family)